MHAIEYDDAAAPVFVQDSGGDGPPVVLVHGLGGSGADWHRLGVTLSQRYRVVSVDLPGFGRSRLGPRSSTVPANEALLARFLGRYLDRPAVLVGASMGGTISLAVAAREPHRVAGLVLVNPWLARLTDTGVAGDRPAAAYRVPAKLKAVLLARRATGDPSDMARQYFRLCCAEPGRVPRDVAEAVVAAMTEQSRADDRDQGFRQAAESLVTVIGETGRYRALVRAVRVPTLVAHGTADRLVPQDTFLALQRIRPDWRHRPLPGAGHAPHLEEPGWLAHLIDTWLDEQDRAPVPGDSARV
ncbi:MAG TPA: alpha/beta hydrolase, partial [Rugosimonospora sp.]|nr:alpha/beta hydrolase [Rugosimonospora sp.]